MNARSSSACGLLATFSAVRQVGHITSSSMSGSVGGAAWATPATTSEASSASRSDRASHPRTLSSIFVMVASSTCPRAIAAMRPSRSMTNVSGSLWVP